MKKYILDIFKIIVLYNAVLNGYTIKKINNNSYELKIKDDKSKNFNLKELLDHLIADNTDLYTLKKNYNKLLNMNNKKNNIDF
jgi:hypothetical protein